MAAEYEVNISLNTKKINAQLSTLEKRLSDFSKAADPLGGGTKGAQRSKNLDRIRATGVIINRLGRELNKLESQGVKVQNERARIKRAVAKLDKGMVETARAHVVETRDFIKEATKGLKIKEKTVKFASVEDKFSYRRLRALARSNERNEKDLKLNTQMTAQARARMRLLSQSGAKGFDATRPQGRQMSESINALTNVQDKRARLLNKINEMEAKGLNVQKLRKQLGKATTEQSARRLGSAEKEFRILEKTLRLEESKLRILREQRKGFPSSPIQGTATMAGSPKQIAEFNKQAAIDQRRAERDDRRAESNRRKAARVRIEEQKAFQGRLRAGAGPESVFGPLRQLGQASMIAGADEAKLLAGRFRAPSSPLTARPVTRASAVQAAQQVEELVKARAAAEKRATDAAAAYKMRADKRVHRAQLDLDRIEYKNKVDDIVELANLQIKEGERAGKRFDRELKRRSSVSSSGLTGQTSSIRGSIFQKGSPNQKRFEGVALGAGFPALFGGGAGSIIGGGLGGLTGSFGAQIALSAIGQSIDQFVAGMVDAGKALTSVGSAADFMAEKSLFSSDAMQFRIEKLIEEGKVTEAAALMTQEMAKKVGGTGLKALKDLGTEASKMGKLFGTLMLRIQAFMAQALTPLLKLINSAIGGIVAQNQLDQMLAEAKSPEQRAAILARSNELRGTKKQGRASRGRNAFTMEMLQTLQSEFPAVIPEGAAIEPTGLEVLRAQDAGKDKGVRDKERLDEIGRRAQESLQIMQQEGDLAKELKKLDFERAAQIDKINKLENVGIEERQNAINNVNNLFDARKGQAIGEALGKDLQTAISLKEKQEDILRPLEDQRRLLEGKLEGKEKEVRLQLEIESIMRSVKGLNGDDVEAAVRKKAALEEQVVEIERQRQLYEQIGQTIKSGLVDGIMSALDGTKSLGESLSGVLRQLGVLFLNAGIGQLGRSFKIPGFANGGRPPVGRPSIVGERGPELFVPDRAGKIIPNNALGGANVTINVDASGSSVEGNADQASQLGKLLGAAVQQELVKQKRPGGLLAS